MLATVTCELAVAARCNPHTLQHDVTMLIVNSGILIKNLNQENPYTLQHDVTMLIVNSVY